jgi:hypothetical protein
MALVLSGGASDLFSADEASARERKSSAVTWAKKNKGLGRRGEGRVREGSAGK